MEKHMLVESIIQTSKYGTLGPFSRELLREYGDGRVHTLVTELDDRRLNPFSVFADRTLDYKRLQLACVLDENVVVKEKDIDSVKRYSSQLAALDSATVDTLLTSIARMLTFEAGRTIAQLFRPTTTGNEGSS